MRRFSIIALLACLACNGPTDPVPPVTDPPDTQATRDSAFAALLGAQLQAMTKTELFSGAVIVMRDGQTLFEDAYGLADRDFDPPAATQLSTFIIDRLPAVIK